MLTGHRARSIRGLGATPPVTSPTHKREPIRQHIRDRDRPRRLSRPSIRHHNREHTLLADNEVTLMTLRDSQVDQRRHHHFISCRVITRGRVLSTRRHRRRIRHPRIRSRHHRRRHRDRWSISTVNKINRTDTRDRPVNVVTRPIRALRRHELQPSRESINHSDTSNIRRASITHLKRERHRLINNHITRVALTDRQISHAHEYTSPSTTPPYNPNQSPPGTTPQPATYPSPSPDQPHPTAHHSPPSTRS